VKRKIGNRMEKSTRRGVRSEKSNTFVFKRAKKRSEMRNRNTHWGWEEGGANIRE
jgi:hypothetical protein